ncbi:uncharacterized protein LOC113464930 [Ceratina calcarata]|uniref:Gustatory receptor n=1 Tax=Ceratina calcarata TaxID=156304 RepID=A0AAJ7S8N4_9HYME|nr:uncharacterized protein LOC113464930 [Ceratina calcarata]
MKLFHPFNVYDESWLLLGVIKLLGLYPIKFFRTMYTDYIYVIILLILYANLYLCLRNNTSDMINIFLPLNETFIVRVIRLYTNLVLFPVMMISSIRQSSKIKETFGQIDFIDTNVKFLNTEIDHVLPMKYDIVMITSTVFAQIMFNLVDYYGLLDNDSNYMYVLWWIFNQIPDFVNVIIICSFVVLMSKIKFRFRQVKLILDVITKGQRFYFISETTDMNEDFRYKLLKWLHSELRRIVSVLNEAYEFRFKILLFAYISYVCFHMCILYKNSYDPYYAIDTIITVLCGTFDLIKLVYLIHLHRNLTLE